MFTAPSTSFLCSIPKSQMSWTKKAYNAFQHLKETFRSVLLLFHTDPNIPFTVFIPQSSIHLTRVIGFLYLVSMTVRLFFSLFNSPLDTTLRQKGRRKGISKRLTSCRYTTINMSTAGAISYLRQSMHKTPSGSLPRAYQCFRVFSASSHPCFMVRRAV